MKTKTRIDWGRESLVTLVLCIVGVVAGAILTFLVEDEVARNVVAFFWGLSYTLVVLWYRPSIWRFELMDKD